MSQRWQWDQEVNGESWFIHSESDGLTIYVDPIPCNRFRLRAVSRQDARIVTFTTAFADLASAKERGEVLMEVAIDEFAKDRA